MQFRSDNAASVHPRVWAAMKAADDADSPYDGDALSGRLDEAFSALFERDCAVLWVSTGTAANAIALATMVPPHGAAICHRDAHIETSEGGAPGFYTHGAKLILAPGKGAKLRAEKVAEKAIPAGQGVHWVRPHAVSITQTTELGQVYTPTEVTAIGDVVRERGLRLHMDGARFANAVAALECRPAAITCDAGVDVLSFGFVKNGGMNAEALVFFDDALAEDARLRHKRGGHLLSKGRFLAAQLLAMVENDLWLDNARAANAAAARVARGCEGRLLEPVESNQLFVMLNDPEKAALREQGFSFYDHGPEGARFVTAWDNYLEDCDDLAKAIAAL